MFWQIINQHALLLEAHWFERWCASLVAQVRLLACPVQRQLLQGGPDHAAASHHVFMYYMLMC